MKVKLNANASITRITFELGARINQWDKHTHLVIVEGHLAHWMDDRDKTITDEVSGARHKVKGQSFLIQLHADEALCKGIQKLVEDQLATDVETFPRD